MKHLVYSVALAICLVSPAPATAQVLTVLGVKENVDHAAQKGIETGDAIAQAFAKQALMVIAEWEKSSKKVITTALDGLDDSAKKIFTEINNVATRIEKGQAVAFIDVQRTMAAAGDLVARLPTTNNQPAVSFYWPTVMVPGSKVDVPIRVIGTWIAKANPRVVFGDQQIEVKKPVDNEINFPIERAALNISNDKPKTTNFELLYDVDKSHWYNPFSWGVSTEKRDIEVTMLPSTPGSITLVQTVRKTVVERTVTGPHHLGSKGKDAPYRTGHPLTPLEIEQGWIVDKEKQAKAPFNHGDGDGGSTCTGYDSSRFSDHYVAFNMQHGSTGPNHAKRDAYQNCSVYAHLKRNVTSNVALASIQRNLNWLQDIDLALDPNVVSYDLTMTLYTGQVFTIKSTKDVPYSLFEITPDKTHIKIRPRAQREF